MSARRRIVPANLFGGDDTTSDPKSGARNAKDSCAHPDPLLGVLTQFFDIIRQVPETLADQRCKELLSSFCASQGGKPLCVVGELQLFVLARQGSGYRGCSK